MQAYRISPGGKLRFIVLHHSALYHVSLYNVASVSDVWRLSFVKYVMLFCEVITSIVPSVCHVLE